MARGRVRGLSRGLSAGAGLGGGCGGFCRLGPCDMGRLVCLCLMWNVDVAIVDAVAHSHTVTAVPFAYISSTDR